MRQLAPAESFEEALLHFDFAGDPNDSEALAAHMGPYYPAGRYCTLAELDRDLCGLE